MVNQFQDRYLASLYDRLAVNRGDEEYYLRLIAGADRVLDVGCGTGTLLHRARQAGHRGRLVGLDPSAAMLDRARRYTDVEWRRGTLPDAGFDAEFDLIVMTGHAFQELQTDDQVRDFFAAAHHALDPAGHLAFETRNPAWRAWEEWTPDDVVEIQDDGSTIRVWHEVHDVDGEYVSFTETYASDTWAAPIVSHSRLRFVSAEHLDHLLAECGFVIDERYGDWDRSLCTHASREIITVARRADHPLSQCAPRAVRVENLP